MGEQFLYVSNTFCNYFMIVFSPLPLRLEYGKETKLTVQGYLEAKQELGEGP